MPELRRNAEVRRARFIAAVKAEAQRRIDAIAPDHKQKNLMMKAIRLQHKYRGGQPWSAEDQAAWDAGVAISNAIDAIRAASDTIETMPLATDPTDEALWP